MSLELTNPTRTPELPRQTTSNEELTNENELLLTSALGTATAREKAFAELAVGGRSNAPEEQEFLSASHWNSLPDDAFTTVSRSTP